MKSIFKATKWVYFKFKNINEERERLAFIQIEIW
jgi:hypothetical protein